MSIEWTRAEHAGACGGCGRAIESGDRVRVTMVTGVTRPFVRCGECAGGAPPELPAEAAPRAPERDGLAPLQSVRPATRGALRRMSGNGWRDVVHE